MSVFQNRPWETNVYLSLGGTPSTGLIFSDLIVNYKKFGETALSLRPLNPGDLVDLGDGLYTILWPQVYLNVLGTFLYTLNGTLFDNFLYDTFEIDPQPASLTVPLGKCVLTGNVTDIGGNPALLHQIVVRPAEFPVIIGSTIVDADAVFTVPDQVGNFTMTLLQGQTVIISIDRTGIRTQIDIPFAPVANLTDLIVI